MLKIINSFQDIDPMSFNIGSPIVQFTVVSTNPTELVRKDNFACATGGDLKHDDKEWKKGNPPRPGIYIASSSQSNDVLRYWDGAYWHYCVGMVDIKQARSKNCRFDNNDIEWLRLIEADK
jgi:hypothetical protein